MENNTSTVNGNISSLASQETDVRRNKRSFDKKIPVMIVLAVLALSGVGFGIFGMISGGSKVSDLEQKLAEQERVIADLKLKRGDAKDEGGDGGSSNGNNDGAVSNNEQIFARSLLIAEPDQALNKGFDGAFSWNLSTQCNDLLSLELQKQVGGLTDFEKEYYPESEGTPMKIGGWINREVYNLGTDVPYNFEITGIDVGRVVDMAAIQFGNGIVIDDLMAFFLMDDGTVEYMPVGKALVDGMYKSYGKISDVENVIKFMRGSVVYGSHPERGIFAQRADGKFYDLWESLHAMGEI